MTTPEINTPAVDATRKRPQARPRIIAIGRSASGQPFQVMAPNSLAYSLWRVPGADLSPEGGARAEKEMFADGYNAYFDRRGPGFHKVRASGWLAAYHEEQQELAAREEERREQF